MELQKQKTAAAWLSVTSNVTLVVLKIIIGLLIGSVSVISEAIHSAVDLLAAVIALVAVKQSGREADETHPFGHGKIENISGTIEAILIFVAAGWIIYEAALKIIHPHEIETPGWGVLVMAVSAGVNYLVSGVLFRVGKKTDSIALQADGWHLRTDVWTSLGVMAGLMIIWAGDAFFPRLGDSLHLVDPVAAIAVALLIIHAAWKLTMDSARDLIDSQLPPDEQDWIRQLLDDAKPEVKNYHRLRTRKAGSQRFVEFHMRVDPQMTVQESHLLAHAITDRLKNRFPGASVTIHVEPYRGD